LLAFLLAKIKIQFVRLREGVSVHVSAASR